jgi:hypothetical protein
MVTNRDPGRLFHPDDICPSSGRPVINVLRAKHPYAQIPALGDFDQYPDDNEHLESTPIYCYKEQVVKAEARLSVGAGPCVVEETMLWNWILCHEIHSKWLCEDMAWVCWLSNGSPPYAAYRGLNTVQELAADKRPGIRPLGCGETWMCLIANCNHMQTWELATVACGNTQLCAGLRSGIEANLHAVRAIWPHSAGWSELMDNPGEDK